MEAVGGEMISLISPVLDRKLPRAMGPVDAKKSLRKAPVDSISQRWQRNEYQWG